MKVIHEPLPAYKRKHIFLSTIYRYVFGNRKKNVDVVCSLLFVLSLLPFLPFCHHGSRESLQNSSGGILKFVRVLFG